MDSLYHLLWFAHPILQSLVAGLMFWRKLHRKFPVFFTYIVTQIVVFGVVFAAHQTENYPLFFYSYWICAAVSLILGFKVIHEIFLDVFRPYHALKDLGSVLFRWAALVMLLVALVVAAASPGLDQGPIVESVLTVQRCVRVIQVGLILFLIVFSKYVGVSWRQHSFGISLGFGAFASAELMAVALRASGHISPTVSDLSNMIAYNISILIWAAYSYLKSPSRDTAAVLLTSQRWNQGLADLQPAMAPSSLIPRFEDMVDRAFSRTTPNPATSKPDDPPSKETPAPPTQLSSKS